MEYSLVLWALLASTFVEVSALPWFGAKETLVSTATANWSPKPTKALPFKVHELLKRGTYPTNLCGWQGPGFQPAYCSSDSYCARVTDISVVGCCKNGGKCDAVYSACLDGNHGPQTSSNSGIYTCKNSKDVCYRNTFVDGYYQWGCGSTSVGQTVDTSYPDINKQLSLYMFYTGGILTSEKAPVVVSTAPVVVSTPPVVVSTAKATIVVVSTAKASVASISIVEEITTIESVITETPTKTTAKATSISSKSAAATPVSSTITGSPKSSSNAASASSSAADSTTTTTTDTADANTSKGLSTGVTAAIAIIAIVILLIALSLLWFFCVYRKRKNAAVAAAAATTTTPVPRHTGKSELDSTNNAVNRGAIAGLGGAGPHGGEKRGGLATLWSPNLPVGSGNGTGNGFGGVIAPSGGSRISEADGHPVYGAPNPAGYSQAELPAYTGR